MPGPFPVPSFQSIRKTRREQVSLWVDIQSEKTYKAKKHLCRYVLWIPPEGKPNLKQTNKLTNKQTKKASISNPKARNTPFWTTMAIFPDSSPPPFTFVNTASHSKCLLTCIISCRCTLLAKRGIESRENQPLPCGVFSSPKRPISKENALETSEFVG